jgi:tetratricopeptide (TPR) repeat protein
MFRVAGVRWSAVGLVLVAVALLVAPPAFAQQSAMKGVVVDQSGKPVEGATIIFENKEKGTSYKTKSDKNGSFTQIGLPLGNYRITAEKEKLGTQTLSARSRASAPVTMRFVLGGNLTEGEKAKIKQLFDEGNAATKAGDIDLAIAKFTEGTSVVPTCFDCYYSIGTAYLSKKDYEKAEAAFKKTIELKPDYAEAYNGLAAVYNAQQKFDDAKAMGDKAAALSAASGGGEGADTLYNEGVIAWNAGKIDDATKFFEDAIKMDPDHANSHYQLGMARVNAGKLDDASTEFTAYLKLAPDGEYAAQAKAILGQLPKK